MKIISTSRLKGLEHELSECKSQLASMTEALTASHTKAAELQQANEKLNDEIAKVRSGAEASGNEMLRIRRQYDALKKEYDAYRANSMSRSEAEKQVSEIRKMLTGIDDLKEHYERRIKHLRHALADARAMLSDRDAYQAARELDVIDLSAPVVPAGNGDNERAWDAQRFSAGAAQEPSSAGATEANTDWLEPLPD